MYRIREEHYYVVEKVDPEQEGKGVVSDFTVMVATFDTLREAEAVRDSLNALQDE